jgi:phage tail sheath protein FI
MPEYLSPGVYIEEFEIGAKPIEGVSTSTAGFVGMAERGPLDRPTLVTSFAEYQMIFGGYLDTEYGDKCYLPYSVEGFFSNGGKRLYVTRVADKKTAKGSSCFLPNISGSTTNLAGDVRSGAITLKLTEINSLAKDDILLLKDGPLSEFLKFVSPAKELILNAPLRNSYTPDNQGAEIFKLEKATTEYKIAEKVDAGATKIKLIELTGLESGDPLIIEGDESPEIGVINLVDGKSITLKSKLTKEHGKDVKIRIVREYNIEEKVGVGETQIKITDTTGLVNDAPLIIGEGENSETGEVSSVEANSITLKVALTKEHEKDEKIRIAREYNIEEKVAIGENKIILDDITGLISGTPLIIGEGENSETGDIDSVINIPLIKLESPLLKGHEKEVVIKKLVKADPQLKTETISTVKSGYTAIPIAADDNTFNETDYINIGSEYFKIIKTDAERVILVAEELKYQHSNDPEKNKTIELVKLVPAIEIEASNEGEWGNNIKIVVKESSILSGAKLTKPAINQDFLELDTVTGIEKGTLLKLPTTPTAYATVKEVIKTDDIKKVILESDLNVSIASKQIVSTVEFDLIITFEGASGKFEEIFTNLSLNEIHSRYVTNIITPETSLLIRIKSVIKSPDPENNILMPTQGKEPGWKLGGGNNGIPTSDDLFGVYKGAESSEPEQRTGLQTLMNIDDISIVAMPGITTQELQSQLIIHCETLKNRFAVLDSIKKADLDSIQNQRNLYDSKFAALYYPWIRIFDSMSKKPINVPPSGHMCGIYARSDNERGVHKAPANEVASGALDLEEISESGTKRIITKGQQDILNPKGINCIRIFPGRGIRVWGARTISSDPLWKYINIRRLFIYIEESIYKGTQWVVFEPNNEKLWGRVKATIDEFLTRVWRDGALMGLKPEEAFFIKCDRTTMTQADIDNGRLVCVIGIAPVKPAEFVIFRIAQWAGGSAAKE